MTREIPGKDSPSACYYRAVEGRWKGALDLRITDWSAFFQCPMGLMDRMSLLSLVVLRPLLGTIHLATSVDYHSGEAVGEVVHTTRVYKWGMTFLRSVERLTLDANGRDLTMRIELRLFPTALRVRTTGETPASIDATGYHASYRFPWFGTEMHQTGERSADGNTVVLTQETVFSRSVQVLQRQASS